MRVHSPNNPIRRAAPNGDKPAWKYQPAPQMGTGDENWAVPEGEGKRPSQARTARGIRSLSAHHLCAASPRGNSDSHVRFSSGWRFNWETLTPPDCNVQVFKYFFCWAATLCSRTSAILMSACVKSAAPQSRPTRNRVKALAGAKCRQFHLPLTVPVKQDRRQPWPRYLARTMLGHLGNRSDRTWKSPTPT